MDINEDMGTVFCLSPVRDSFFLICWQWWPLTQWHSSLYLLLSLSDHEGKKTFFSNCWYQQATGEVTTLSMRQYSVPLHTMNSGTTSITIIWPLQFIVISYSSPSQVIGHFSILPVWWTANCLISSKRCFRLQILCVWELGTCC